jgi:hypothetical protein
MSEKLDEVNEAQVENEEPRGAKAKKRWVPKEWRPEYTAIVAMSCTGLSNEAVGKHFNYGKQQISNILNTPEAKEIRKLISAQVLKDQETSLPDRLRAVQDIALQRVEEFVNRADLMEKSPFQTFDRHLKLLQSTGTLESPDDNNKGGITNNTQNNFILSDSAARSITEGLKLAERVADIHKSVTAKSVEPKKLTGLVAD